MLKTFFMLLRTSKIAKIIAILIPLLLGGMLWLNLHVAGAVREAVAEERLYALTEQLALRNELEATIAAFEATISSIEKDISLRAKEDVRILEDKVREARRAVRDMQDRPASDILRETIGIIQ